MTMFRHLFTLTAGALVASASLANNCDTIRAGIDAKIRASGVTDFRLTTLPADAPASGRVVGSCDQGTKKIVYAQAASAPAAKTERIITECKDGSTPVGGACPK
jgi:hypothetical protein